MTEEAYANPVYSYALTDEARYLSQGPWSGGPIETVGYFAGRLYLRFPNQEAVEAASATEENDFRLATEEELAAAGLSNLAAYPLPTPGPSEVEA